MIDFGDKVKVTARLSMYKDKEFYVLRKNKNEDSLSLYVDGLPMKFWLDEVEKVDVV